MKRKLRLRPWVKVAIMLVIGVTIVSKIFSISDTSASDGSEKTSIVHGVIEMNLNGESHLKPIDGGFELDLVVETKEDYHPMQIVSVVLEGEKIMGHYLTEGEELDRLMDSHKYLIEEYRDSIYQIIYE
jgi:hypothetical protein